MRKVIKHYKGLGQVIFNRKRMNMNWNMFIILIQIIMMVIIEVGQIHIN